MDDETSLAADHVFRELIVPWSRVEEFASGQASSWVSEISDDNTPLEFSVTLSPAGNEVRVLFEPQGALPTLAAHRQAALDMHDLLEQRYGADLRRFHLVKDLFAPPGMQGPFALWSAVVFANGKVPSFKAYFNPQAQGAGSAVAIVEEGLRRVGLPRAWQHLATTLARRGPHRDELKYFALDLSAGAQARVKVYVRHHEATAEDLEVAASAAPGSTRGEAEDFAKAMGGGARRFRDRATFTCAAFVGGQDDRPSATTQYVPVCAYALDDQEVVQRVASYLSERDMDDGPYRRLITAFTKRPLNEGVGMQSWVAFRRYNGVPRLTVYLSSETRRVFPVGSVPAATRDHMYFENAEHVLRCVDTYRLEDHPLVRRLGQWTEQRHVIWLLVSNAAELIADTLEVSAARLSTWLADNADIENSLHSDQECLRHAFIEAVRPFRESSDDIEAAVAVAVASNLVRNLAKSLAELLEAEETSSAAFTLDAILREERPVDAKSLVWLGASGSASLASVTRGAFGVHQRLWSALDALAAFSSKRNSCLVPT